MRLLTFLIVISILTAGCALPGSPPSLSDISPIVLSEDGGWCWFESPRAMICSNQLLIGSVASGWNDSPRKGDIELIIHDLQTGTTGAVELHDRLQLDDHDSPALLLRPDGRFLAMYAKHGNEDHCYYRVSEPRDPTHWGPVQTFTPSESTRLTYSNLAIVPAEKNRIYDFYRGLDNSYKPSFAYSDDLGSNWTSGAVVIRVPSTQRHRPYVCYATNNIDTVHLLYTEAHPRDYDNSLYHVYYKAGLLHRSDGTPIAKLSQGLDSPDQGTRVFQGDADHVAWSANIVLDAQQRPVAVYSVQVGSARLPQGQGGDDIRYRYARWDGHAWQDHAMAYAGSRLYAGEDDYSGLAIVEPDNPAIVYISTNADPSTAKPLISAADGKSHYELFRGMTLDGGASWRWTPITDDSTMDNLRPIRPMADGNARALIWLRGTYRAYTDYQQQVVGIFWNK